MALLNPAAQLPADSRDALELFDERFVAQQMLAVPQVWTSILGDETNVAVLETKYPMTMLALKFIDALNNDPVFEEIGEKSVTLTTTEKKAGVHVRLLDLLVNTFTAAKWAGAPEYFAQAEQLQKLVTIATDLDANTELCGWDDLALFHDSHLANPKDSSKGTFDNLQATPKDVISIANIEAEFTLMKEVKDINGDPLGVKPDTIAVPRQKAQGLINLLNQQFVPNAAGTATMNNPYYQRGINVMELTQLPDVNDWYIFDSNLVKIAPPWILAKLNIPAPGFDALSIRRHDERSQMFLSSGKIGVDYRIFYGRKFLYPHGIRKVVGA